MSAAAGVLTPAVSFGQQGAEHETWVVNGIGWMARLGKCVRNPCELPPSGSSTVVMKAQQRTMKDLLVQGGMQICITSQNFNWEPAPKVIICLHLSYFSCSNDAGTSNARRVLSSLALNRNLRPPSHETAMSMTWGKAWNHMMIADLIRVTSIWCKLCSRPGIPHCDNSTVIEKMESFISVP